MGHDDEQRIPRGMRDAEGMSRGHVLGGIPELGRGPERGDVQGQGGQKNRSGPTIRRCLALLGHHVLA